MTGRKEYNKIVMKYENHNGVGKKNSLHIKKNIKNIFDDEDVKGSKKDSTELLGDMTRNEILSAEITISGRSPVERSLSRNEVEQDKYRERILSENYAEVYRSRRPRSSINNRFYTTKKSCESKAIVQRTSILPNGKIGKKCRNPCINVKQPSSHHRKDKCGTKLPTWTSGGVDDPFQSYKNLDKPGLSSLESTGVLSTRFGHQEGRYNEQYGYEMDEVFTSGYKSTDPEEDTNLVDKQSMRIGHTYSNDNDKCYPLIHSGVENDNCEPLDESSVINKHMKSVEYNRHHENSMALRRSNPSDNNLLTGNIFDHKPFDNHIIVHRSSSTNVLRARKKTRSPPRSSGSHEQLDKTVNPKDVDPNKLAVGKRGVGGYKSQEIPKTIDLFHLKEAREKLKSDGQYNHEILKGNRPPSSDGVHDSFRLFPHIGESDISISTILTKEPTTDKNQLIDEIIVQESSSTEAPEPGVQEFKLHRSSSEYRRSKIRKHYVSVPEGEISQRPLRGSEEIKKSEDNFVSEIKPEHEKIPRKRVCTKKSAHKKPKDRKSSWISRINIFKKKCRPSTKTLAKNFYEKHQVPIPFEFVPKLEESANVHTSWKDKEDIDQYYPPKDFHERHFNEKHQHDLNTQQTFTVEKNDIQLQYTLGHLSSPKVTREFFRKTESEGMIQNVSVKTSVDTGNIVVEAFTLDPPKTSIFEIHPNDTSEKLVDYYGMAKFTKELKIELKDATIGKRIQEYTDSVVSFNTSTRSPRAPPSEQVYEERPLDPIYKIRMFPTSVFDENTGHYRKEDTGKDDGETTRSTGMGTKCMAPKSQLTDTVMETKIFENHPESVNSRQTDYYNFLFVSATESSYKSNENLPPAADPQGSDISSIQPFSKEVTKEDQDKDKHTDGIKSVNKKYSFRPMKSSETEIVEQRLQEKEYAQSKKEREDTDRNILQSKSLESDLEEPIGSYEEHGTDEQQKEKSIQRSFPDRRKRSSRKEFKKGGGEGGRVGGRGGGGGIMYDDESSDENIQNLVNKCMVIRNRIHIEYEVPTPEPPDEKISQVLNEEQIPPEDDDTAFNRICEAVFDYLFMYYVDILLSCYHIRLKKRGPKMTPCKDCIPMHAIMRQLAQKSGDNNTSICCSVCHRWIAQCRYNEHIVCCNQSQRNFEMDSQTRIPTMGKKTHLLKKSYEKKCR